MTDKELRGFNDFLPKKTSEDVDLILEVERRLAGLTPLERGVLYLYAIGHTQAKIGEIVGYSQRHIGRILKDIANKAVDF